MNTSFARNFQNCNESAPSNGYYVEDWSDGSEDVPYSMVTTDDEIVVSALMNRLIMWEGTNDNLGNDTGPGLHCDAGPCSKFDGDYYLWGEAYLLIFRKSNLSLKKATHLGTMSGGDFIPKVIKTSDGGFAVSGTVTGCPEGLPTVSGSEHMMVIKLDNNGNILWRKHYNGQSEGGCGFALTESPDGGIVLAGNTDGDGPNSEENYGFIKFGSDCDYDGANVLPNSGNDYIVAANEPVWNTSRLVKARVVVPNGRTLTISAWYTKFIDNQRSAIFMQYPHNWNQSMFTGCEFISNGPLVDPGELRQPVPNDYNNNEPRGTSIHVSIWSTRVQFSSCKFNGALSIIPEYRPFGIEGDDPKIVASGGSMKDMKIGIECRGMLGGVLATVNANGIAFDNVVQGVNLRNSVADIVGNCKFLNIPTPNTFSGLSPSGIFGQFNKGALINFNEFYGVEPGKPSWGIVEHNTQNQGCEIRENRFFTTRVGNQFEGGNTQLDAFCNDYTGMGLSGWFAAVTFGAGQLKDQGSSLPTGKKADNEFFDFCDGSSNLHIEADDNFTPFSYYDKTGNPHSVDPDCVNDIVNVDVDQGNLSSLACAVPEPPCPNPPCDRVAIYMASPKTIRDRNVALRGLVHAGFAADTSDLNADYEGAFTVLRDRNQPEDRSILVGSLAGMGRYAEAQTENALLTTSDAESAAYKAYLTNILSTGAGLSALSAANYQTAMASLTEENASVRTMAENLRYLREGIYSPLIAVDPEQGGGERSQRSKAKAQPPVRFPVQPNPFNREVLFDLSSLDATVQYHVILNDLYGKQIGIRQVFGGRPLVWNAASLPDGQYIYQIRTEKAVIQSGKLLKTGQ